MSRLSMEERMAHYKKKYAGGEVKHSGNKEHSRRNVKHHPHISANGGQANLPKVEQNEKLKPQEQMPPTHDAPARKGIMSKIMGLFKKK